MIYEFFTDKTSAPLTNYFSKFMPTVKLLDYTILDYHTLDHKECNVKRFIFGFEGNSFKLYLSPSDTMCISSDNKMPLSGEFHLFCNVEHSAGTSSNNKKMMDMKSYLVSFIREQKINQIL